MTLKSFRKILWSFLAGASLALMGCDEDKPPADSATEDIGAEEPGYPDAVYYGPPDMFDMTPVDTADTAEEDAEDEDAFTPVEYGPPPP